MKKIQKYFNDLCNNTLYSFSDFKSISRSIPTKHGVYIIYSKNKSALHVGRSITAQDGLRQRLNNHRQGKSSFVIIYFHGNKAKIKRCKFRYIVISNYKDRAYLEAYAIGVLCPKHIK